MILPTKTLDVLALQTELADVTVTVGSRHLFFYRDESYHRLQDHRGRIPEL
jgi:hypothetical protein